MKKVNIVLFIAIIVALLFLVFYVFQQETVTAGKYTVLYHKNMCELDAETFPQDLESLKKIPCVIRVTWQEKIGSELFQEYCYLPGVGVEKTRMIHKKD
jgi:hypothetical protein